ALLRLFLLRGSRLFRLARLFLGLRGFLHARKRRGELLLRLLELHAGVVPTEVDVEARNRLAKLLRRLVGHSGLPDVERLELAQAREMRDALIGHLRTVEIQVLEMLEPRETREPRIRDLRELEVKPAKLLEVAERGEPRVGHLRPRQVEPGDLLRKPRELRERLIGRRLRDGAKVDVEPIRVLGERKNERTELTHG